jgi:hypothetical protein
MNNLSAHDQIRIAVALACVSAVAAHVTEEQLNREPQHDSVLTGEAWVQELLDSQNKFRMYNALGVDRKMFLFLLEVLIKTTEMSDSTHVRAETQLAIFLFYGRSNAPYRTMAERFQHSTETIER